MERKKIDFAAIASGMGKSASEFLDKAKVKAVEVMDQNADGKLDMSDVSDVAGALSNAVKNKATTIKEAADLKAQEFERKALMPFFDDDVDDTNFALTKLIRICDQDKRRMDSEVCKGSIGYYTEEKDVRVVNIYRENINRFGISFYPDEGYEFYYVDPSDRDRYIALDEYFSYLKIERISELQKLAQDLGAKHFRVTYKEEKTAFSNNKVNIGIKASGVGETSGNHTNESNNYSAVEIAAEMDCPGHAPIMPTLKYLQRDASIQNLIALRMDEHAPLSHQKFMIKMSNSSGIRENDAIKIDAVLKALKFSGNATVTNETKNESRRYLEYEIDF